MATRTPPSTPHSSSGASANPREHRSALVGLLLALAVTLGFLFRDSFRADLAMFANDGPLGLVHAAYTRFPGAWFAVWADLNWFGLNGGNTPFDLTSILVWLLGPLKFINFYPGLASATLGLSAWIFFRQLRFQPAVCAIGGLAAALNSDFFSYACWGLGTLTLCVASVFLALAALASDAKPAWARPVLAGTALGLALMEGFDNGAILSLYVAAFAVFLAWNRSREPITPSTPKPKHWFLSGALATAAVAVVSAVVASHVLISLIQINITGTVGMGQDRESREKRWMEVTLYGSLPPGETLRAFIPGLYGYRMDSPNGANYWGRVGSHPAWDEWLESKDRDPAQRPGGGARHSGAGHYSGIVVLLLAAFGVAQSLRKDGGALTPTERRWVWFWTCLAIPSLFFAFGRFSFAYRFVYALPYFNSIRLPMKFLHPMNMAVVILCGYGLQALWRGWMAKPQIRSVGWSEGIRNAFRDPTSWDRRWAIGTVIVVAAAWLAWLIYGSNRMALASYLQQVGFKPEDAKPMAQHSIAEVLYFAVVLTLAGFWLLSMLGKAWTGPGARVGFLVLGALLAGDLTRSNLPWVQHYNWRERLARDPLIDTLAAKPHEGRVGAIPLGLPGRAGQLLENLTQIYSGEWNQHQFRYHNIQSWEVVQLSRPPAEYVAFQGALQGHLVRSWELGNVRWLLGLAPLAEPMNQQLDPEKKRFRVHLPFNLSQTPAGVIRVETNATGPFALLEFTGALPRTMLFDQWRSGVSDEDALRLLPSTNFNPHAEVLVSESIPAPAVTTSTQPAGSSIITAYSPTRLTIETDARTPCVLLLNDKYDKDWKVTVDGKEDSVLHANYVARGVYLTAGKHRVEFRFQPSLLAFYISLVSLALAAALLGYVLRTTVTSRQWGRI